MTREFAFKSPLHIIVSLKQRLVIRLPFLRKYNHLIDHGRPKLIHTSTDVYYHQVLVVQSLLSSADVSYSTISPVVACQATTQTGRTQARPETISDTVQHQNFHGEHPEHVEDGDNGTADDGGNTAWCRALPPASAYSRGQQSVQSLNENGPKADKIFRVFSLEKVQSSYCQD